MRFSGNVTYITYQDDLDLIQLLYAYYNVIDGVSELIVKTARCDKTYQGKQFLY